MIILNRYQDKSFRVLITLHNLAAINEESARTIEDLVTFLNLDRNPILEILNSLIREGLVSQVDGRYYLNYLGTLRILTTYT